MFGAVRIRVGTRVELAARRHGRVTFLNLFGPNSWKLSRVSNAGIAEVRVGFHRDVKLQ